MQNFALAIDKFIEFLYFLLRQKKLFFITVFAVMTGIIFNLYTSKILYFGEITESNIEIWLNNSLNVAGFQFVMSGLNISGVSGGSAEQYGFMVSNSTTTVVGFSLSGSVIPVGNALLLNLLFDEFQYSICPITE